MPELPSLDEMNKIYADALRKVAEIVERGDYHVVNMHNESTYPVKFNRKPFWRTFHFEVEYVDEGDNSGTVRDASVRE